MQTSPQSTTMTKNFDRIEWRHWKMIILASSGGGLDYFDFVVYAIFARYISVQFFPTTDPSTSILLTFAVFMIGFFCRPVGGMVLGHFGDRYGRKSVFIYSLLGMSLSTLAIGVLPTYASWGIWATISLVFCRIAQGLSVGGEVSNAQAYVVESAPHRASFVSGLSLCFVNSGVLLATVVNYVLQSWLTPADIGSFGWRIPFLIGGALGFAALLLRRTMQETPEFQAIKATASAAPLIEIFKHFRGQLVVGIGTSAIVGTFNGLLFAFMPYYLTNILKYSGTDVAKALNVALLTISSVMLLVAWLGDRLPKQWIMRIGAAAMLVLALPFFNVLTNHSADLLSLFMMVGLIGALPIGIYSILLGDMFPTRVRFSGSAFGNNIGVGIVGGVAPLLATWLISITGFQAAPAIYLMVVCLLTVVSTFWLPRYLGQILK